MKLLLLVSLCFVQQVYGDACGKYLRDLNVCVEQGIIPQPGTANFKAAAAACIRNNCGINPHLDYDEEKDGDATTECANQGLKKAAGPMVEGCMASYYPGWVYAVPEYTLVPGAPDTLIRMALNEIEDSKKCPPSARNTTLTCINTALTTNLPQQNPEQIKSAYCAAKNHCAKNIPAACLFSTDTRSGRICECTNQQNFAYLPAADAQMSSCLNGYTKDPMATQGVMSQYKEQRTTKLIDCTKLPKTITC